MQEQLESTGANQLLIDCNLCDIVVFLAPHTIDYCSESENPCRQAINQGGCEDYRIISKTMARESHNSSSSLILPSNHSAASTGSRTRAWGRPLSVPGTDNSTGSTGGSALGLSSLGLDSEQDNDDNGGNPREVEDEIQKRLEACRKQKKSIFSRGKKVSVNFSNVGLNSIQETTVVEMIQLGVEKAQLQRNQSLLVVPEALVRGVRGRTLTTLQYLDLSHCHITVLHREWNLPNLTTLDLSHNRLKDFPSKVCTKKPGTTTMTIKQERSNRTGRLSWMELIRVVPRSIHKKSILAFDDHATNINVSYLSFAQNILRGLPLLKSLDLYGNRIMTLPDFSSSSNDTAASSAAADDGNVSTHSAGGGAGKSQKESGRPSSTSSVTSGLRRTSANSTSNKLERKSNKAEYWNESGLLENLTSLNVGYNDLTSLPNGLPPKLKIFIACNNFFSSVPYALVMSDGEETALKELDVASNPISVPPPEVCESGLRTMRRWYKEHGNVLAVSAPNGHSSRRETRSHRSPSSRASSSNSSTSRQARKAAKAAKAKEDQVIADYFGGSSARSSAKSSNKD